MKGESERRERKREKERERREKGERERTRVSSVCPRVLRVCPPPPTHRGDARAHAHTPTGGREDMMMTRRRKKK